MASIDIGSNTVRLLVAQLKDCRIAPFRYGHVITRLAGGLSATGRLSGQAIDETVEVLRSYNVIATQHGVSEIVTVGTGALREARNTPEFIQRVREQAGVSVEVLPGDLEAELTALGVLRSLPGASDMLVLDIGGASTEMVAVREGEIRYRQTIPMGVVKLLEQHVSGDPPSRDELDALEAVSREIGNEFSRNILGQMASDHKTIFVSTAGTPTTLAAMDLGLKEYDHSSVHGHRMTIERLEDMLTALSRVSAEKRVKMGCLDPKRADLIIPGLILTIGIMKSLGFHEMTVSDHGLLEGLLLRAAGCGH